MRTGSCKQSDGGISRRGFSSCHEESQCWDHWLTMLQWHWISLAVPRRHRHRRPHCQPALQLNKYLPLSAQRASIGNTTVGLRGGLLSVGSRQRHACQTYEMPLTTPKDRRSRLCTSDASGLPPAGKLKNDSTAVCCRVQAPRCALVLRVGTRDCSSALPPDGLTTAHSSLTLLHVHKMCHVNSMQCIFHKPQVTLIMCLNV